MNSIQKLLLKPKQKDFFLGKNSHSSFSIGRQVKRVKQWEIVVLLSNQFTKWAMNKNPPYKA